MLSVIIPVYNEEDAILGVLDGVKKELSGFVEYEVIVVNDGSTDATSEKIKQSSIKDIKAVTHTENLGYGKSIFDGMLHAKYDCIAIMDGDGSYPPEKIKELYAYYPKYDMIVGARCGREYDRGVFKRPARMLFKFLAEYASGRKISDVNSGFRIFKKGIAMRFQDSLCLGFSFTTSVTLFFLLNHYYVKYIPIEYQERIGKSKVRHFRDTLRTAQLVITAILYYNPVKLFLLIASLNSFLGFILWTINHIFLKITFISVVAALCIASFIPVWSLGFIAEQLNRLYNLNNRNKI